MKKAFSLVEILICVAIIGILAAIVLPAFQSNMTEAREAAAKDTLRILRNAIELYAVQHNGVPPGYPLGKTSLNPVYVFFITQLIHFSDKDGRYNTITRTAAYPFGPYLSAIPKNPFNNLATVRMIANGQDMPAEADGIGGWVYKAATKKIKLNWPGTDSKGVRYYDY